MTLYVTRSIGCDAEDCDDEYEGFPGERADKLRQMARAQGWRRRAGRDYCPKHASEAEGAGE